MDYKEKTVEATDTLGVGLPVTVGFYHLVHDCVSIESYELDGENISREELVERFGEDKINAIEVDLLDE